MEAGRCTAKPTTRYSSGSMGYTLTAALQSRSSICGMMEMPSPASTMAMLD